MLTYYLDAHKHVNNGGLNAGAHDLMQGTSLNDNLLLGIIIQLFIALF